MYPYSQMITSGTWRSRAFLKVSPASLAPKSESLLSWAAAQGQSTCAPPQWGWTIVCCPYRFSIEKQLLGPGGESPTAFSEGKEPGGKDWGAAERREGWGGGEEGETPPFLGWGSCCMVHPAFKPSSPFMI